jgi:hypothetical protein
MKIQRNYERICAFCEEKFIAHHGNKLYCSERCKRDMFGKKVQENRDQEDYKKVSLQLNNSLLTRFWKKGKIQVMKEELINAGFELNDSIKNFQLHNKLILLYENFLLESISKDEYAIRPI